MTNISYHGTNKKNALIIVGPPSIVSVNIGKGELGKGFYTGSSIALAAIWAQVRYGTEAVVIEFDIPKPRFVQLKGKIIKTQSEVVSTWANLKLNGETNTYLSGYDYIVAPFAIIEDIGYQFKFESQKAEDELNACYKSVYQCVS
ncbi:hypothetical protein ACVW0P_004328 [Mucilaginibacter sp. UYNi724]